MSRRLRIGLLAIGLMISVPLLALLYDSRWNTEIYRCGSAQTLSLLPNLSGYTNSGEVRLEGSVRRGEASISGFPGENPASPPQVYSAGSSASQSYAGDMYDPVEIIFDSAPNADCELRVTYRLKSGLSLANPLW